MSSISPSAARAEAPGPSAPAFESPAETAPSVAVPRRDVVVQERSGSRLPGVPGRSPRLDAPVQAGVTARAAQAPVLPARVQAEQLAAAYASAPDDASRTAALDGLAALADRDGRVAADALAFKFRQPGRALAAYRAEFERVLTAADADVIFSSLSRYAQALLARGKDQVVIVNATFAGGGVAEMFQTYAGIMKQLGIEVCWYETSAGRKAAYGEVGRKAFDAFQGGSVALTDQDKALWAEENVRLERILAPVAADSRVGAMFLEDHHGIHLTAFKAKNPGLRIIWRSHVDNAGLLARRGPAADLWDTVMKPNLQTLDAGDSVLFQPGSVPLDAADLRAGVFTQPPGIDLLSPKNQPLTDRATRDATLARIAPGVDPGKAYFVAGGRFVAWKGLLPALRAFQRIAPEHPEAHLLLFGAVGSGDARKTQYKALIDAELAAWLDMNPEMQGRVVVVLDQNQHIRAFYDLAAQHRMPWLHLSLREGYGLMTDEATRHGTMVISSSVGGLVRYATDPQTMGSQMDLEPLAAAVVDPVKMYKPDLFTGGVTPATWAVDAIERVEAQHMAAYLKARQAADFSERYEAEAHRAHVMTLMNSLVAMSRDYLAYGAASAAQVQAASKAKRPGEVAPPSSRLSEVIDAT
jgi:glycosyltransferase involved in cell wall biosynthesis